MKEKIRNHFLKFGPRRFVVFTVLTLVILDLINSWYMKLYWKSKDVSLRGVQLAAAQNGMRVADFGKGTIDEMKGLFDNAFYFFLLVILVNNFFFYFFYLRKKLWAQGYVLFYALTAALFSLAFVMDDAGMGFGWMFYNASTILIYTYIFLGVKLLKAETVIIPEGGKKGR